MVFDRETGSEASGTVSGEVLALAPGTSGRTETISEGCVIVCEASPDGDMLGAIVEDSEMLTSLLSICGMYDSTFFCVG